MNRPLVSRLLGIALIVHLALSAIAFATMDIDVGGPAVRRLLDHVIDFYELVGFDVFPVGIVLVALVLGVAWGALRRGSTRDDDPGK